MKQRFSKKSTILTMENILGLILALLIIFQILPSVTIANGLNNPVGVIFGLILVVIFFMTMNPIVGFLLLIYLYEIIQTSNNFNKVVYPITRNTELQMMNTKPEVQLEETIIRTMEPIKNENQGNNVSFSPVLEKLKM